MNIKKGDKLYVRIDYKAGQKGMTNQDLQDHLAYIQNIAGERYLIGGGFSNADGGMIIMEADSLEEARRIFEKDPLIERAFYRFDLFEWGLVIISEDNAD
ncbi:MAG: YciI family protein [Oscillospiraceae bacterium]|nr:YciI family protein [Oscillospiraceae bacterium]